MKYAFIQEQAVQYPIRRLCGVLGVSASGYYDWCGRAESARAQANRRLLSHVKAIHQASRQRYGSPRVYAALKEQGIRCSKGRVERLMRRHGLVSQRTRRHRRTYTHRVSQASVANHLNREFRSLRPNEKWVSDITFIPTRQGWLYLAIVLDLYSRAIVGWSMSRRINGQLVHDALDMALQQREVAPGLMLHSDQGSQYTAQDYQQKLIEHGLSPSMSRKGECHDNAVAESFFHTLKEELVHDADYKTHHEARQAIFKYIELFYNRRRHHSYLGYTNPFEYEKMNVA